MDYFGIDASELAGGAAAVAAPVDLAGGAAPAATQPPLEGGRRGRKHHHMNLRSSLHHIWRSGGGEKSGSISKKAMEVMHSAVVDIAKRVAHEAADLRTKAGGRTIMERDIEIAQHRVIPKFDLRGGEDAAPAPPLAGGTETAPAPLVGGTETAPATLAGGEEVPAQVEPMTTTLAGGKSLEGGNLEGGNLEGGSLEGGDLEGGKKKKHHKRTKSKSPHKRHSPKRHSPKRHSPKRHSPKRHSPKRARKSMMGGESAAAEPVIAGGEVAPAAAMPESTLAGGESAPMIEGGEAPAPELQGGKHKKSRKSHTKGEMMSVARVARILRTESRGMRVSSKAAHRLAVVLREVSSAIFSAGRDHMGRTKNSRLMPMHVHGAVRWIRHRIAMRTSVPLR